jgi:hypothetical protein
MTTFWLNDPSILLNNKYITQLWPMPSMSFEAKLNAMTRIIILLTILGLVFTKTMHLTIVCAVALIAIVIIYNTYHKKANNRAEGFKINGPEDLAKFLKKDFETVSRKNPLGNVLLTDIGDNPERHAAPPSFNIQVYEDINNNTKDMIQSLNPSIKNTNKQLFGDLGEKFEFDQSQRAFYSTANTRVASDQGAYAQFLYGDMPSCRGGDAMACVQDNPRYNMY